MAFKFSIKVDVKNLKKVRRELAKLNKTEIKFGWINGAKYSAADQHGRKGLYVAEVASRNNYGSYTTDAKTARTIYIPARPYMEQAVQMCKQFNELESEVLLHRVLHSLPYRHILKGMAETNAGYIKKSIAMQNMQGLHKRTIAMKGHNTQWDDTGVLMRNITGRVKYVKG